MKKEKEKRRTIKSIVLFPLPVYLSYLVVCTLLLTGVSFSRYISQGGSNDSTRVAAGGITVSYADHVTVEMERPVSDQIQTEKFSFCVSNNVSEVAVKYDVLVTVDQILPEGIIMNLDGIPCSSNSGNTYIFADKGIFAAGESKTYTHTLSFSGDYQIIQEQAERNITISVQAEQID